MTEITIQTRPITALIPYVRNARTHSEAQVAQIAASIDAFGMVGAIVVRDGVIAKGHGTISAIRNLYAAGKQLYPAPGIGRGAVAYPPGTVPVLDVSGWTDAQFRAYVIADNKLAENAGWDRQMLALELGDLEAEGFDLDLTGFDPLEIGELSDFGDAAPQADRAPAPSLAERFGVVPLSVLNARRGWWVERKRAWIESGITSEIGRGENLVFSTSHQSSEVYDAKNRYESKIGRKVSWGEFSQAHPEAMRMSGTSVFDPVLCELVYRWFCPDGGLVLDPFAGGSVRGWVAAKTGRQYVGCDLRTEQVEANRAQWSAANPDDEMVPVWACGDSREIDRHAAGVEADLVFSCPPYADLEVYSDDPADLSNMAYADFVEAYREIIRKSVALLKQDRFACFVVGEVRGKGGAYRNFVGDTIRAFIDAGASYYNEAILVTQVGSLAIRAAKMFTASRKISKTHQNVLVFVKGDAKAATAACGEVEIDPALFEAETIE